MSDEATVIQRLIAIESRRAYANHFEVSVFENSESQSTLTKDFQFFAAKINLGSYTIDANRLGSTQLTLIDKVSIPDKISITVKEMDDWRTFAYFYKWFTVNYYNPETKLFRVGKTREGSSKRKTFKIKVFAPKSPLENLGAGYGPDNDSTVALTIEAQDALLVGSVALPDLNMQTHNPIEQTYTIQSDNIKISFNAIDGE